MTTEHNSNTSIARAIQHASHLLPAQGPIMVFIHHNTLHAFEDLSFSKAVVKGGEVFGCQPFLLESQYREYVNSGRITHQDIVQALLDDLGDSSNELLGVLGTRFQLRMAMLEHPWHMASSNELHWFVGESDLLNTFWVDGGANKRHAFVESTRRWVTREWMSGDHKSDSSRVPSQIISDLVQRFGADSFSSWSETTWQAFTMQLLWRVCHQGAHGQKPRLPAEKSKRRHRSALLHVTGKDIDVTVNEVLIRFCSVFLDQGFADWSLPGRDQGLFPAFLHMYANETTFTEPWRRPLSTVCKELLNAGTQPLESIADSLLDLGIGEHEWDEFIASSFLPLRGWAGMIWQIETRGDRAVRPIPKGSLEGYLAIRLILERMALKWLANDALGYRGALTDLPHFLRSQTPQPEDQFVDQLTFQIFQMAQYRGWTPDLLMKSSRAEWNRIGDEIQSFSSVERRRIFHLAYELHFRQQSLDAISIHAAHNAASRDSSPLKSEKSNAASINAATPRVPDFQVVCCIDEREESFRRHLEEFAPECESFGVAGFFGVVMYYRGAADAHFVPLCPIVVVPKHYVIEEVAESHAGIDQRRRQTRQVLGAFAHWIHRSSRAIFGGAMAAFFGAVATVPLVARILFPRLTAQLRQRFGRLVSTPRATLLTLERNSELPGKEQGELGFTLTEMAGIVERVLRDIGLTKTFSKIVVIVGHGSSSLNNPHESAHDCGACGGGRGGPNARAFAQMANDPRVRRLVHTNGVSIPDSTHFVGAYHNTCDDSLAYFDLEKIPLTHREIYDRAKSALERARRMDAHERCRRFELAPTTLSPEEALRHVEGRSEDLAQVRPEYGHATNAICIVGRRERTRGLYLDRRAFLPSYDPTQDDANCSILTRILQAVVPVCGGISLEYYFSFVDPGGYGCATKLPHNITSLLGVMDGAASDLRTGLPWQMVEIHEPVRLLFVIETKPELLQRIIESNPPIAALCYRGWVQVATLDPDSPKIHVLKGQQFEPYDPVASELPQVATSMEWYRGLRDHLTFAEVGRAASSEKEKSGSVRYKTISN